MELMKVERSEEVVLGKVFVPVFGFFFMATEIEFMKLRSLKKFEEKIHIVIDPMGRVMFDSKEFSSSN
jgi:hypothetical protein